MIQAPRRLFLVLSFIGVAVLAAGCIQTRNAHVRAELPRIVEDDADVDTPIAEHLPPDVVVARVEKLLAKAEDLVQQNQLADARDRYNRAFKLLLAPTEPEPDEETAIRLEQLYLQVNLGSIRVARLRGVRLGEEPLGAPAMEVSFNAQVEKWMNYFLTTGRSSMVKYLERMGEWEPMIDAVLAEKNLPADLKYLPIIESGFSPYAYSPAQASGLWQFIPATGRRYGLTIDEFVDERRDPEKATRAAADYLAFLYDMFDDWSLALAAYNCGENRVAREIASNGTRNYWELPLPLETVNYVPKFYAAMMIARDPEVYGFYVTPSPAYAAETFAVDGAVNLHRLAELAGLSPQELKHMNPAVLGTVTPPASYALNIPAGTAPVLQLAMEKHAAEVRVTEQQIKLAKAKKSKAQASYVTYRVRKGDTLSGIARKYRTTVTSIKRLNRGVKGHIIRPGAKLKIRPGSRA
ncbi:transglycosylase SLT domain-containing protein [bacterium]|nr:transglycosylase SLT domain-containing protein [bacterium]